VGYLSLQFDGRKVAGDRHGRLELNRLVQRVVATNSRRKARRMNWWAVNVVDPRRDRRELTHVMIGTADQVMKIFIRRA